MRFANGLREREPLTKPKDTDLTAKRLRALLDYEPDTGIFRRKTDGWPRRWQKGQIAGTMQNRGYVHIWVDGRHYLAHRLAWLHVYGEWPNGTLDHINSARDDNRMCNIRIASGSQNNANSRKSRANNSGIKGVSWHKPTKKWQAQITVDRKNIHLGYYATTDEARDAYKVAAIKYQGEFARFD